MSKLVTLLPFRDNVPVRFTIPIGIILIMSGCTAQIMVDPIPEPGKTIVPRGSEGIVLASETESQQQGENDHVLPDLRVQLPPDYLASQVYTINLDLDDTEEQIIVFKRRGDATDLIRILIVSFDPIRNNWIRAWEGETEATNVRSFTLYTDDLIGNHEQEIVCFGINNAGEQTLDVFRRTKSSFGLGLAYTSILSISADVNIRIDELERSAAFEAMEASSARSFPVIVERRDPDGLSPFDTVETVYLWNFTEDRYMPGSEKKISGEAVQDSRLRLLFQGSEANFEEFLSGPWYRPAEGSEDLLIAYFGTADRTIVFHNGHLHLQQAFNWDDTAKTVYGRGVQIFVTNEILRSLKRRISVSVEDLNRITVTVPDSDGLNGSYDRLTGSLQDAVLDRTSAFAALSEFQPRGLYTSDEGVEIVFGEPDFSYRDASGVTGGGYVLFTVGPDLILELKFIDANRLPVESRRYGVQLEQAEDDDRLIRRMILQPGFVGLAGFQPSSEPTITLEQIEVIDNPAEDNQ